MRKSFNHSFRWVIYSVLVYYLAIGGGNYPRQEISTVQDNHVIYDSASFELFQLKSRAPVRNFPAS